MKNKNYLVSLLLLLAGGVSALAFAPFNRPIFLIISLFILFWYIEHTDLNITNTFIKERVPFAATDKISEWPSFIKGLYCYAFGYFVAQLYWVFYSLYVVIGSSFIVALIAVIASNLYLASYTVFGVWLFKKFITRSKEFNYLFLLPSTWVVGEWLRSWLLAGFSWCDVSYTQVNNYLLKGFFPLWGSYGVSWLSMSIIGFLFLVVSNRKILFSATLKITVPQRLAIVYFVMLVILGYGLHDREYTKPYGKPTSLALVQGNITELQKWDSKHILDNLRIYADIIAKTRTDIILLPETAFVVFEKYLPAHYLEDIINLAKHNHAQLVIGMPKIIDKKENYVNALVLVTNPREPYYAKHHLVPYGEYIPFPNILDRVYALANLPLVGFSAGMANPEPIVIANQKIAFNLCYENGFGSELIDSAKRSTLMINSSDMVWYGTTTAKDEHLQLSQARALENQRYFVQETNTGLTAIIDPNGLIKSELPAFQRLVLHDYVMGRIGETPYERCGNYPIIIFCLIFISLGYFFRDKTNNLYSD